MVDSDSRKWNSVIRVLCMDARKFDAFCIVAGKLRYGVGFKLDGQVISLLIKSCSALSLLKVGKAFHGHVIKSGFMEASSVSKGLMNMYAKCGETSDCKILFERMRECSDKDPVVWNILLSGLASSRDGNDCVEAVKFFRRMCGQDDIKPTEITAAVVLSACTRLRDVTTGKSVHCYAIKSGLESMTFVGNALISMYAKCGSALSDAYAAFCGICHRDVISWNAMIAGFAERKIVRGAFYVFKKMLKEKAEPNYATIANILPLLGFLDISVASRIGKMMHWYMLQRKELVENVFVMNALLSFYFRVGLVQEAELFFRNMKSKDLVTWNSIIAGYTANNEWLKAVDLFTKLLNSGKPQADYVTFLSVLPACANLCALEMGKEMHSYILKHDRLCKNTAIGNALVSFYAMCDDIFSAYNTFWFTTDKDVISWTTMLDTLSDSKYTTHIINLLHGMMEEGVRPDSVTMLSIVRYCAVSTSLDKVKESHCYSMKAGFLSGHNKHTLVNSIIDGYGKCGNAKFAYNAFQSYEKLSEPDITTWNTMIKVYAENDFPAHARSLFNKLQGQGMKPDAVTIMSILPVCSHMALLHQLKQCHGYAVRSCFDSVQLMGALLDSYSKCGNINCAEKFFHCSPEKDLVMFTAMVGGYAMHGMGEEATRVYYDMLDQGIKPDHVVITSVLSACSHSGQVDEGWNIFLSIGKVHRMKPTMEHYTCVVDLFARAGRVKDAYSFAKSMPIQPNSHIWAALIGACQTYNEIDLGHLVADRLLRTEAGITGSYVMMSNSYAADAKWDSVAESMKLMRSQGFRKLAGCSWIEVIGTRSEFRV